MSARTDTIAQEPSLLRHDEDGITTLTLNLPQK